MVLSQIGCLCSKLVSFLLSYRLGVLSTIWAQKLENQSTHQWFVFHGLRPEKLIQEFKVLLKILSSWTLPIPKTLFWSKILRSEPWWFRKERIMDSTQFKKGLLLNMFHLWTPLVPVLSTNKSGTFLNFQRPKATSKKLLMAPLKNHKCPDQLEASSELLTELWFITRSSTKTKILKAHSL